MLKGLGRALDFLGCAKLALPVADVFRLCGECVEVLLPIGCLQLYDLKEVVGAC